MKDIEKIYDSARNRYRELGVDTDGAIKRLGDISISLHCWQGDDVGGFETAGAELSGGGIQTTGNYTTGRSFLFTKVFLTFTTITSPIFCPDIIVIV